jgi:hypothetical protein
VSGLSASSSLDRAPRVKLLAVLLSGVIGTLVAIALMPVMHTHSTTERRFGIAVPAGWTDFNVPGTVAAIHRTDGKATLTVRQTAPVRASGVQLVHDIGRKLRARFPDFKPVNARFVELRGGRAFVYTFAHGRTVQVLALASARGKAYELDGVAAAGNTDAARDLATVVRSFGP